MIPARSLCTSPYHKGPRWMLALYFYRRRDGLQHRCKTCCVIGQRPENLTAAQRKRKSEYSRQNKAAKRRERGVPVRKLKNPTLKYGEGRVLVKSTKLNSAVVKQFCELHLAGLNESDARYVRRLGRDVATAKLSRVDVLLIRYHSSMAELEDWAATEGLVLHV